MAILKQFICQCLNILDHIVPSHLRAGVQEARGVIHQVVSLVDRLVVPRIRVTVAHHHRAALNLGLQVFHAELAAHLSSTDDASQGRSQDIFVALGMILKRYLYIFLLFPIRSRSHSRSYYRRARR